MSANALEIENLTVRYGAQPAVLRSVSMSVPRGDIVGIVGESGSGKSTVVRAALQLLPRSAEVTSGSIRLDGNQDLLGLSRDSMRAVRGASIGYVSQNPFNALSPMYTIGQQFLQVSRAHDRTRSRESVLGRAIKLLRAVGIKDPDRVLNGYASQLSGGMAQRVLIAMAMLLEPPLIIADEPTTGLDVTVQKQILDLLASMVATHESTMIIVTHDLGVVAQYCGHVAVMHEGVVVEAGPVSEVFVTPTRPYTATLLDSTPERRFLRRAEGV